MCGPQPSRLDSRGGSLLLGEKPAEYARAGSRLVGEPQGCLVGPQAPGNNSAAIQVERIRLNFGGMMAEAKSVPVLFVSDPIGAARNGGADRPG